jgi:hypothetical protein
MKLTLSKKEDTCMDIIKLIFKKENEFIKLI